MSSPAASPPAGEPVYGIVLRLAAPIQSWGGQSQFNRRDTMPEPTKGGIVGLLAAAQGRRRSDPIEDLLRLRLGVRTDQPGTLLRDYHTASDHRGRPLLSAQVNAKGLQKLTSPPKPTHVTNRFYLQDAVFVAAVCGPEPLLHALAHALRHPTFPLALGRRACPPTQPLLLTEPQGDGVDGLLWPGQPTQVLQRVAWQASDSRRAALTDAARRDNRPNPATVDLPITADADRDHPGYDVRADVPVSFDPRDRRFTTRTVVQDWARAIPTGLPDADDTPHSHDPFALLGW